MVVGARGLDMASFFLLALHVRRHVSACTYTSPMATRPRFRSELPDIDGVALTREAQRELEQRDA